MKKQSSLSGPMGSVLTVSEKRKLAETMLSALGSKNWELFLSIISDDISWTLPGSSSISGEIRGVNAVIDRAKEIVSNGVSLELKHILYGQYNFALSIHNQASRGDLILDEYLATVCTIYNGKIAKIETYVSDVEGVNKFFIRPNM